MESWKAYLQETYTGIEINDCELDNSRFFSKAKHSGTNHDYYIRHIPITLLHIPRDKSGRTAQKYKERTEVFDKNSFKNQQVDAIEDK